MDYRAFDSLTRYAAGDVSRRGSLLTLGVAGLAAILAGPFSAAAKKKQKAGKKKKKNKTQAPPPAPPDLCAPQVEECAAVVKGLCGDDPVCQDAPACCSHLATCNATAFLSCFLAALNS